MRIGKIFQKKERIPNGRSVSENHGFQSLHRASEVVQSARMDFERDYLPKLGFRARGFQTIFTLLYERWLEKGSLLLVETGCIREEGNWGGDGNSSIMFNRFAEETGSKFVSIDIEPRHCHLAMKLCSRAHVICSDSVTALYRLRRSFSVVDFLYLDSFDVNWDNPHPSALHHLKELCASVPLLQPGSIVFVDDNREGVGKGMYVKDFMDQIGAQAVHEGYQLGFICPQVHEVPRSGASS